MQRSPRAPGARPHPGGSAERESPEVRPFRSRWPHRAGARSSERRPSIRRRRRKRGSSSPSSTTSRGSTPCPGSTTSLPRGPGSRTSSTRGRRCRRCGDPTSASRSAARRRRASSTADPSTARVRHGSEDHRAPPRGGAATALADAIQPIGTATRHLTWHAVRRRAAGARAKARHRDLGPAAVHGGVESADDRRHRAQRGVEEAGGRVRPLPDAAERRRGARAWRPYHETNGMRCWRRNKKGPGGIAFGPTTTDLARLAQGEPTPSPRSAPAVAGDARRPAPRAWFMEGGGEGGEGRRGGRGGTSSSGRRPEGFRSGSKTSAPCPGPGDGCEVARTGSRRTSPARIRPGRHGCGFAAPSPSDAASGSPRARPRCRS